MCVRRENTRCCSLARILKVEKMWMIAFFLVGMASGGSKAETVWGRKPTRNLVHNDLARYMSIAANDVGTKIFPTNNADLNAYPFVVYIVDNLGRHICSGSLVKPNYVLTAAHCLGSSASVVLGDYDRSKAASSTRRVIAVEEEIVHPNYTELFNDVGLIKLASAAVLSSEAVGLVPMLMSKKWKGIFMRNRRRCMVLGWGVTQYNKTWYLSHQLQEQKTLFVGAAEAEARGDSPIDGVLYMEAHYPRWCKIGSICYGDSGGPTVCDKRGTWVQVGIVSFFSRIDGCVFGIKGHVDVDYYIDWITEIISGA